MRLIQYPGKWMVSENAGIWWHRLPGEAVAERVGVFVLDLFWVFLTIYSGVWKEAQQFHSSVRNLCLLACKDGLGYYQLDLNFSHRESLVLSTLYEKMKQKHTWHEIMSWYHLFYCPKLDHIIWIATFIQSRLFRLLSPKFDQITCNSLQLSECQKNKKVHEAKTKYCMS